MQFCQAIALYHKWAKQFPGEPQIPNEGLSIEDEGLWHLSNVNGPLAVVTASGDVVAIGKFWSAYERLAEDGKCDSPGGGEYRRVLREWIDDHADDLEEFIHRRANSLPW